MNVHSTPHASARSSRAIGALTLLCGSLAAIVTSYSLHAGMRFNAIRLPFEEKLDMPLFLPQGWKFFTRDAREERTFPFARIAGRGWVSAAPGANGDSGHLLGARRDSRAHGAEIAALMHQAEGTSWTACTASSSDCLDAVSTLVVVVNTSPRPTLCGDIGIVRQAPVPWAWSRDAQDTTMPSRAIRLAVQC